MRQAITIFVIALVLALPIYTADVLAVDELYITRNSGKDNIQGYLREYDQFLINVDAKIEGDSAITPNQLKLNTLDFKACNPTDVPGHFACNYSSAEFTSFPIEAKTYPMNVEMYSDAGKAVETRSTEILVDNLPPVIEFDRNPIQSKQEVSVAFTVKDAAWRRGDYTKCTGIKKVEFYDNEEKLDELILNIRDCTYSDTVVVKAPASERVIIKAYDLFDQFSSETSGSFDMDLSAPVINPNSFKMFIDNIELGDYVKAGDYSIDIEVEVAEESLEASGVKIDLTRLGGAPAIEATSCTQSNGKYLCKWIGAGVSLSSSVSAAIPITAEDVFGNTGTQTISRTFNIDNSAPTVTSISTDYVFDGQNYIGTSPTDITVKISETGSGLSKKNVYLSLSSLGLGSSVRADECSGSWQCVWKDISASIGSGSAVISVTSSSTDDVGNQITGEKSTTVIIDTKKPDIIGQASVKAIRAQAGPADVFMSGDNLQIVLNASDASGIRASGDFSSIKDGDEIEADCVKTDDYYTCQWLVESIKSGYISSSFDLNVYDGAGNLNSVNVPITVYGKTDEDAPDYWSVASVDKMPEALDRQTVPLVNQRMYFHYQLTSSAGASIMDMSLGECTGDTGYLNVQPELFNQGSTDPYIMAELKKSSVSTDSLKVNCTLNIISLYNNEFISGVEQQPVELEFQFYNMPLGEASSKLQGKIEDEYDTWVEGWAQWVGAMNTFFKYSQLVCQSINTIQNVVVFLKAAGSVITKAETVADAFPPASAGARASRITFNNFNEFMREGGLEFFEIFNKYCAFVNCKLAPSDEKKPGTFSKWGAYFGGGGGLFGENTIDKLPWGSGYNKFTSRWTGKDPMDYMNTKDSLVVSLTTLCIPGIIYNVQKYREINCFHIDCLQTSISTGVPSYACDHVKEYQTCKYIAGEIFQFIPFGPIVDYYSRLIQNALSNPLSLVGLVIGYVCKPAANSPDKFAYPACSYIKIIDAASESIGDIVGILDADTWDVTNSYCHIVEDRGRDFAVTGVQAGAADTGTTADTTDTDTDTDTTTDTDTDTGDDTGADADTS